MKTIVLMLTSLLVCCCSFQGKSQLKQTENQSMFIDRSSEFLTLQDKEKLKSTFLNYQVMQIDLPQLYSRTHSQKNNIPVTISHGATVWEIELHENEIRSIDYKYEQTTANGRIEVPREACGTFAGYVKSDPNSFVRMNVREHSFSAIIFVNGTIHFIELLNQFLPEVSDQLAIIYSQHDVVPKPGSCGGGSMMDKLEKNIQTLKPKVLEQKHDQQTNTSVRDHQHMRSQQATSNKNQFQQYALSTQGEACKKLEIVTDSDYDNYTSCCGLKVTASEILDNLNNVEPLFQNQFAVEFQVLYQHEWTVSNDPYTETDVCDDNALDRLDQFRDYWDNSSYWFYNNLHKDVAILYSGINFDGGAVGCAYTSSLNNLFQGTVTKGIYMIVQTNDYPFGAFNWSTASFTHLTAHELGHIFGASHDGSASYLMSPTISTINTWSPQSLSQINSLLSNGQAIERLGTRYLITPLNTNGGVYSGGELNIKSNVTSTFGNLSIQGVDHVAVYGALTISTILNGSVTMKIAPCSNSDY